jgi:hypothetical protein
MRRIIVHRNSLPNATICVASGTAAGADATTRVVVTFSRPGKETISAYVSDNPDKRGWVLTTIGKLLLGAKLDDWQLTADNKLMMRMVLTASGRTHVFKVGGIDHVLVIVQQTSGGMYGLTLAPRNTCNNASCF